MAPPDELEARTVRYQLRSFDDIPAELKILIIPYVDLDPATFRSLSLLNPRKSSFLENLRGRAC